MYYEIVRKQYSLDTRNLARALSVQYLPILHVFIICLLELK